MGVMSFGKNRCWGDMPQDAVDDWLRKFGFNYRKSEEYTDAEFSSFFKKAWNHKTMYKAFAREFTKEVGRRPLKSEYRHHIFVGLMSPYVLKLKKKKR